MLDTLISMLKAAGFLVVILITLVCIDINKTLSDTNGNKGNSGVVSDGYGCVSDAYGNAMCIKSGDDTIYKIDGTRQRATAQIDSVDSELDNQKYIKYQSDRLVNQYYRGQ